jgi:undecaprenyl-diphosphatase
MDIPAAFTALAEATRRRGGAARLEFFSLAGLLVVVLVLAELAFGKLGMEVLEGDTSAFDRAILLALRDPLDPARLIGPAWLQGVASDVTSLGGPAVLTFITLAIGGYLLVIRRWGTAALVGLSVASGSLLSTGLKLAFDRPRPDLVPHAVAVSSASFPSGHAMLSAVTYLTVGALLMRAQGRVVAKVYVFAVAVLLTVAIGVSRVYLGVHWPTDVLAGWCVGAAWALLCWLVATWLQRRRGMVLQAGNEISTIGAKLPYILGSAAMRKKRAVAVGVTNVTNRGLCFRSRSLRYNAEAAVSFSSKIL